MVRRRNLIAGGGGLVLALATTGVEAAVDAAALVRKYIGAFNSHDPHSAARYLGDDFTWYDPSAGNPVEGRDKVIETVIAPYLVAVPDLVWEMLGDPIVEGEMLAHQWRRSGTNSAAWPDGKPATNKHFVQLGASIFSVRDGKLATQSDYSDALTLYRQLGWI